MKRHQDLKRCSRMEFKCKIYELIKELDKSMKSTCSQPQVAEGMQRGAEVGMGTRKDHKRKGSECCCRPGCCQESMKFRPPNLEKLSAAHEKTAAQEELPERHDLMGHLPWHQEDHSNGCWSRREQKRSRLSQQQQQHQQQQHQQQHQQQQRQPSILDLINMLPPEELQQMGCFIARAV